MLAFKCDRCGKTFDKYASRKIEVMSTGESGKMNRLYFGERDAMGVSATIDICPSCAKSFQKWLNKHGGAK